LRKKFLAGGLLGERFGRLPIIGGFIILLSGSIKERFPGRKGPKELF